MRTLVLQLARFGDIYQTWPTLRALHRADPQGELHVLVRAHFQRALIGLEHVIPQILPTADLLAPILNSEPTDETVSKAVAQWNSFVESLEELHFDRIINLSFSPFSSFLTDLLSSPKTQVCGYTRHSDGYLAIPDDSSAYFYAQVGIGRGNRYHLSEIFAAIAGVELGEEDFIPTVRADRSSRVVVHLGASQAQKRYPPEMWAQVLKALGARFDGEIVLIGSPAERAMCETVAQMSEAQNLVLQTGRTQIEDLFNVIGDARLLIGADSAPVHIASLTRTPVLNLSSSTVNFWETGPVSSLSRILWAENLQSLGPQRIADEALALLNGRDPMGPCYVVDNGTRAFRPHEITTDDFRWNLIQALYTGADFPKTENQKDVLAFQRLFELSELAIQQLEQWTKIENPVAMAEILSAIDAMLTEIPRFSPNVEPLVQWFETQRLRLPPAAPEETRMETMRLFRELHMVSAVYRNEMDVESQRRRAIELCFQCSPRIRDWELASVENEFQELVSVLQDLARRSTKVDGRDWSSVLTAMNSSLMRRDFVDLADQLQFDLPEALQTFGPNVVF